jgi:hypothetical protein
MANAVQKIKLSPSRDIPFNKLVLSQSNVRRLKAGVSIEQLAESIAQIAAPPITRPPIPRPPIPRTVRAYASRLSTNVVPTSGRAAIELAYETVGWTPTEGARITDALYEEYALQSILIPGSQAHPTKLVQSAAMVSAFEQLLTARIEGAIASGTYDVGLETLTAESFVVAARKTIYTHPGTSAETRLLTIVKRERNRPITLDDALSRLSDPRTALLINSQSGRAAVQVPARSLMLDDGEVERRVRLIRPKEHSTIPLALMQQTHWQKVERDTFARAWAAEVAEVPEFTDSEIHIVAGLLLPIWKRLPNESTRVYRLQSDVGERIIGRKVSRAWAASALEAGTPNLSPDAAFAALIDGKTVLDLTEGLQVRRVRVMGVNRIELTGFTDTMRDRLRAYGLFGEIISWKLRFFVPVDGAGPTILAKVLECYPIARIADRAAA